MKNIRHPDSPPGTLTAQVQSRLEQGLALHQKGDLAQAQSIYEDILKIQPRHFDALHLLGAIAQQSKNHLRAVELISQAIEIRPTNAASYFNRGNALKDLQQLGAAVADYDKAIAIKPDYAKAWSDRGIALQDMQQLDAAVASFDRAIALKPDFAEACYNRGIALQALQQWGAAIASYDRAIALNPDFVEACYNRGNALLALMQFEAAVASYDRAIAINQNYAEAFANRGLALHACKQFDAAVASFEQAIAIDKNYAEAWSNRGNALQAMMQFEAAVASYDRALAIRPNYAEAHYNRGIALHDLMQFDAADASYQKAIAIKPDYAEAYWNRAYLKLLVGEYEEGWLLFEWRWKSVQKKSDRKLPEPLWLGDFSLEGKTIFLHSEQGFGDSLQFCRYVESVAALGAQVILETPEPLVSLFKTLKGVAQVVPSSDAGAYVYDCQSPLMSLPLAFKTTVNTVPSSPSYLNADPLKAAHWKDRLQKMTGLRIGVVWSGGFRPNQPELWEVNARRNMPLSNLSTLNVPGVDFFSLQKGGDARNQIAQLEASGWKGPRINDFTDELLDFSDTAALVANLDLVIAVDTAVAHLAGALGKPVWLLNRFDTCWRWMTGREDTPWYPTMRIFRQSTAGDWDGVMARVRTELVGLQSDAMAMKELPGGFANPGNVLS